MRVGVLTGGGDCPGLNAVLRAIVRKGQFHYGDEIIGFLDAWDGVHERRTMPLDVRTLRGMLPRGGTLLGTRRGSPFDWAEGPAYVADILAAEGIDALIVVGGNGSLTVAWKLRELAGIPVVGVPKTIDNDITGTDVTFGFHTAVQIATDAIDRLHTTAESHDRVMIVEVMGRDAGWIAAYAGIAGGATAILVPERPFDLDEVCAHITARHQRGRYASIVVVAEGAVAAHSGETRTGDEARRDHSPHQGRPDHEPRSGVAHRIAPTIEAITGFETRVVQIGHVQRGGTPNAYDRVLATRFGLAAIDAVHLGRWGDMVALHGSDIVHVSMAVCAGQTRLLDLSLYDDVAAVFFG